MDTSSINHLCLKNTFFFYRLLYSQHQKVSNHKIVKCKLSKWVVTILMKFSELVAFRTIILLNFSIRVHTHLLNLHSIILWSETYCSASKLPWKIAEKNGNSFAKIIIGARRKFHEINYFILQIHIIQAWGTDNIYH